MSADVYILASPTPTLFIYPSALHPPVPPLPMFGGGGRDRHPAPKFTPTPAALRRKADETALAVLGAL